MLNDDLADKIKALELVLFREEIEAKKGEYKDKLHEAGAHLHFAWQVVEDMNLNSK